MAEVKKKLKVFWTWAWECIKRSFISVIMYIAVSVVLFMVTFQDQKLEDGMTIGRFWWCFGLILAALAYNGFTVWVEGGSGYEMLVAGNMKRISSPTGELKMTSHKEHKEYRIWKGFAIGAVMGVLTLVIGIIWGANQAAINQVLLTENDAVVDAGLRVFVFVCMIVTGWSVLPFMFMNVGGVYISYYLICLLGLLPVAVSGIFYIVGAYARRKKTVARQEAADREAAEQAAKPKKINYGGLPGTKPRKRK